MELDDVDGLVKGGGREGGVQDNHQVSDLPPMWIENVISLFIEMLSYSCVQ